MNLHEPTDPTPGFPSSTTDEELVRSEKRLRALVQATTYVVYRMSADWSTMLGLEGRGFLSDTVGPTEGWMADYILPEDQARIDAATAHAIATKTMFDLEHRVRRADGSLGWTLSRAVPVLDDDGRILEWFGAASDITDRKRAEEHLSDLNETLEQRVAAEIAERIKAEDALRQSQKMEAIGQLTGGIAHDFNNLLASIAGSLELIERRVADGRGGLERYIVSGQESVRRAATLTQRLLAFSRRQTLDPRPTDVNRLMTGMEDLIRRTVGPDIAVVVTGAPTLWPVRVDASQLETAVLNLCINARDAMAPRGGRLTIETANRSLDDRAARERDVPPGQYIVLRVTDTGTGMTGEVAQRAFEPFYTTKPIGKGTGLGLSMVYGFVRQSGGQVRIHSEPGIGTTMGLYLPRHVGEAEAPAAAERFASGRGDGETVLLIDDEDALRMLVADVLEEHGYRVLSAPDGPAGLQLLQSDVQVDLLVTDVGLPGGLNGRQVADAARTLRPELKVLFITGYAENAVMGDDHLDPGMAIFTKPFEIARLAAKVKDMLVR